MTDRVDLDKVMETLGSSGGELPVEDIVAMRNELCAWRAAHHGGEVVVTEMRARMLPLAIAAVEAYRGCVEDIMAKFGFPQGGEDHA